MKTIHTRKPHDKVFILEMYRDDYDVMTEAARQKNISRSELLRQALREKSQRILKELGGLQDQAGTVSSHSKKN